MTPKQLAELEVWLAAGFDLPTALAAVGPDEDDSQQTETQLPAKPLPAVTSRPEQPTAWNYAVAFAVAIALALAVLWLNAR